MPVRGGALESFAWSGVGNEHVIRLGELIQRVQASERSRSLGLEVQAEDNVLRYWEAEGKRRIESDRDGVVTLSHAALTWKYSLATRWENDPMAASAFFPVDRLLDAKTLLINELDVLGEERIADRVAVKLRVKPRPGMFHLAPLPWRRITAESTVWLDVERCIVLKSSKVEVMAVAFDESLSDELFNPPAVTLDPPVPIESHFPHPVSFDEASRRAGFRLMEPSILPERTRLLTWMAADHPKSPQVGALYAVEPGAYYTLTLHLWQETPDPLPDEQWETIDAHGVRVDRRPAGPQELNLGRAMIVRDGIRAMVVSDLPMDLVTQIAASIQPI